MNPAHAWALRNEMIPYATWRMGKMFTGADQHQIPGINPKLQTHVDFAMEMLNSSPIELSEAMVKHQLKLADRQCRIAEMSQRVQDTIIILVTSLWAHQQGDETIIAAADILCQDLTRKLTGERPSDQYFRACGKLADMIIAGGMPSLNGIHKDEIIFPYTNKTETKEKSKVGA